MECSNGQSSEKINRLVYGCAGCADVGFIADDVSRKLRQTGFASAKASCLAGIGAGLKAFIDEAKAADTIITVDGCEVGCAKRVIENIGRIPQTFILTQLGLAKGATPPSDELSSQLVQTIMRDMKGYRK